MKLDIGMRSVINPGFAVKFRDKKKVDTVLIAIKESDNVLMINLHKTDANINSIVNIEKGEN
jgi:hypothetical protein